MRYLISYDIPDNKRRLKLAKRLLDFGNRVQYSVFEAVLEQVFFEKMIKTINIIIDETEDSVRIYPLCAMCEANIKIIGRGTIPQEEEVYIL